MYKKLLLAYQKVRRYNKAAIISNSEITDSESEIIGGGRRPAAQNAIAMGEFET